ncbi:MAG: Anthranilate phosphoribosyltransferase 2 [Chlamydiales bacterium]|nr:Anthranilate phosphoribosyltransferase 2 [Chlamydiales bacterium]
MLSNVLKKLISLNSLSEKEAQEAMRQLLAEEVDLHQTAAFLALLRAKGESPEELYGMQLSLKNYSRRVEVNFPILDIVGTGGDGAHTANISTGAALLTAACKIPVAKHGNRSSSGRCGSADVMEALGIDFQNSEQEVLESLDATHFAFMFAPDYHPALKRLASMRKSLKFPTSFNVLGPLLNPAAASHMVLGVFEPALVEPVALALQKSGIQKGYVFHGSGLDELSAVGEAKGLLVEGDSLSSYAINPKSLGFSQIQIEELKGGEDAIENAQILLDVFNGKKGAVTDAILLNAAMGLYVFGSVLSLEEGLARVEDVLASQGVSELILKLQMRGEDGFSKTDY